MSHCCVVNCKNTGRNSDKVFYRFPVASWKREQRIKWIMAINRKNADGTPWYPKPQDRICSAHFIGGKKADEQDSPSYVPRIFPATSTSARPKAILAMSRYKRYMESSNNKEKNTANVPNLHYQSNSTFEIMETTSSTKIDKECRIEILSNVENEGKTFVYPEDACNIEPEVKLITGPLPEMDPLDVKPEKCCLCAEITDHVDSYKPYLENKKMTLTLNGINVEIDFNSGRLIVCLKCDKMLVDIFNFVQQVRTANSLFNSSYDREETLIVKTESPMIDDNDENDEIEDVKEEIVDAITIDETAFVKQVFVHKERESDKKPHTALKTAKVKDKTCDDSDRIMDIKGATELDDVNTKIRETGYSVNRYTGLDINAKTRKISLINKKL